MSWKWMVLWGMLSLPLRAETPAQAIASAMERLGADSFEDRTVASQEIQALTTAAETRQAALDALARAMGGEDAEIRSRARDVYRSQLFREVPLLHHALAEAAKQALSKREGDLVSMLRKTILEREPPAGGAQGDAFDLPVPVSFEDPALWEPRLARRYASDQGIKEFKFLARVQPSLSLRRSSYPEGHVFTDADFVFQAVLFIDFAELSRQDDVKRSAVLRFLLANGAEGGRYNSKGQWDLYCNGSSGSGADPQIVLRQQVQTER